MFLINPYRFGAAATDPNFANVSLLLHGDASPLVDSSGTPKTITAFGNAAYSTAQSKFGSGSIALDGNGDYLSTPANAAFNFGAGSFTIEAWVYVLSNSNDWFLVSSSGTGGLFFGYRVTSFSYWGFGRTGVAWDGNFGGSPPAPGWNHVALCRNGSSIRLFLNGTQLGSTLTNSTSYDVSTTTLTVGSQGANFYMHGYIDELRITKGVARYTANFTPPTAPFPDS